MQRLLWKCVGFCFVGFFFIVINVTSEESHIWWLRARWDLKHIELSYRGNPLEFLYQFLFHSVMGFSTQSPDHLVLLHFSLYFSVVSDFLNGVLFDRSTRAPYIPVIDKKSMAPGPAWMAGWWMCFPGAVLFADLTRVSPSSSSGLALPKVVTRNWPPAWCSDSSTELVPLLLAVDTCLCECSARGRASSGPSQRLQQHHSAGSRTHYGSIHSRQLQSSSSSRWFLHSCWFDHSFLGADLV